VSGWTFRPGTVADTDAITVLVSESFEGYRAWAPPEWNPPPASEDRKFLREQLADPAVFCLVAEAGGAIAGEVIFMPANMARRPSSEPGLAHLLQLFVRPVHWGSGLARELHSAALREAAVRGYSAMRLFTPAAQVRARAFYEREGWHLAGPPFEDAGFGMTLVQYRRRIEPP
jgi:predicted N-acetyltransferase YhbS